MADLPAELAGKTPEEIVAHFRTQMDNQKRHYETAIEAMGTPPTTNEPAPPPKKTVGEWLASPEDNTRELIAKEGVTRAEFNTLTAQQQSNLQWIAKQRAMEDLKSEAIKRGGSFDWDRVAAALDEVAKKCDPLQLTQSEIWKTNYYYNRGLIADALVKEGVTKATTSIMEPGTAGGSPPPKDEPLTMEEAEVAVGLGLTAETYKAGKANMRGNKFPLTWDNRTRR